MKRIFFLTTLLLSGLARADQNTHAKNDAFYAEAARLAPPSSRPQNNFWRPRRKRSARSAPGAPLFPGRRTFP
jgi:hypothetical protein